MSVQYLKYICSNCGRTARENNASEPKKCELCSKVICNRCSPSGFCQLCFQRIPIDDQKKLDKVVKSRKIFTISIWITLLSGITSLALTIAFGTEAIRTKIAIAERVQSYLMIFCFVAFGIMICVLTPIGLFTVRKQLNVIEEVGNSTRQLYQQRTTTEYKYEQNYSQPTQPSSEDFNYR